ncbi:glycosyltransferase, partial [bacterium]|nr:glycosyltransferase [bacterium]
IMEDRKIRIFYLIGSSEIGGTEKMLFSLIENLDKQKFQVSVIGIKGEGKFTEELRKRKIKLYVFNLKKNLFSFFNLLKLLKKEKPDILHSFLFAGNITGRITGKLAGIKIVISSQRSEDKWRKWYHWMIDRITAGWTDLIISNSFAGKKVLIEKGKISPEKIKVIPNGIEIPSLPSRKEKKNLVVGTVGNLRKVKGHIYLIKAAIEILKDFPEVKFVVIGEGELKNFLMEEIKKAGIEKNFIFTGFVPEPMKYVREFDVFVLTSLWEGCPVSLLEAMSMGVVPVAFGVGDVPYIIKDGEEGFVVEPCNYNELARKIKNCFQMRN